MKFTAENILLWEQRIKDKVLSEMTIEEWCKTKGLSKHKHNYWNGMIRKNQNMAEESPFADELPNPYNHTLDRKDYTKAKKSC